MYSGVGLLKVMLVMFLLKIRQEACRIMFNSKKYGCNEDDESISNGAIKMLSLTGIFLVCHIC